MRWLLAACWVALHLFLVSPAHAAEGTEVVVVLDNSLSMNGPYRWGRFRYEASDPDRRAQLAALILEGLIRSTEDRLLVIPMHGDPIAAGAPEDLRDMRMYDSTPYIQALSQARTHLEASPRTDRLLVLLTDGMPTDYDRPEQGRGILAPDRDPMPFDVVLLALLPEAVDGGELPKVATSFLTPIAPDPSNVVRVRRAEDLVDAMTVAWASTLGSKPDSGLLAPAEAHAFEVGRYVTEVLVAVAGDSPSGPFVAGLTTSTGEQKPKVEGNNLCAGCAPPGTYYATWRLPHDPTQRERMTLRLDRGRGNVTYGIILRYDLAARVDLPRSVIAGDPLPIRAFLDFRGERVNDEAFFGADDFTAVALVDGQEVPLTHEGEGWFTGEGVAAVERVGQDARVEVTFRNTWMIERTRARVPIGRPPRIDLTAHEIDLGSWRGERSAVETCAETRLLGDRPPSLAFVPRFEGIPSDVTATATPLDADGAPAATGASERWRVCVTSRGCCGATGDTEATRIVFVPDNPLVEGEPPAARVRFQVQPTGFLTCWWPWLLGLLLVLLLLFILIGLLRGHDFEPDATVRVAGSERQLSRATAVVLREQPGGRRGFYRNARIALTATGEFVKRPALAAVHLEAVKGGTRLHLRGPLERQDRRTRKMVPVTEEEALDGPQNGVLYRCGGLWIRFE